MKRYSDLTDAEKDLAFREALEIIVDSVCMSRIRFDDKKNGNDLQKRIDAILRNANLKRPWFVCTYLAKDEVINNALVDMAEEHAEAAFYPEPGERVICIKFPKKTEE